MSKYPVFIALLLGMSLTGCHDGSIPSAVTSAPPPAVPPPPPQVAPADVAGIWFSRIENNAVNCGEGVIIDGQTIAITQNESDIMLLTSTGNTFSGTVNGDIVEWSGDFEERGGTTTYTSLSITVSANSASGNAAWTWASEADNCNGTMDINANRDWGVEETDFNSRLRDAEVLNFADSVAFITGTARSIDDKDYFSFVLAADATVQAELSHFDLETSNLDLVLIDKSGNQYAISDNVDSFEKVDAQLQAGTTYYIGILPVSTPGGTSYNLSVDVN